MKMLREILIIFLFTIFILEMTLQLFYYVQNGALLFDRVGIPIYNKDVDYSYRVKPLLKYRHKTTEFNVTYYTNSNGFRCSNKIEEYHDMGGKYTILLNGPSFAFGVAVNYEQSFAAVLEKILDTTFRKKDFQIINFGVPGRPLPIQIRFLERQSSQYNPKLVLQFAYGSMMIRDGDAYGRFDVKDGYLIDKKLGIYKSTIAKLKKSAIIFYSWIAYNKVNSLLTSKNADGNIVGAGRDLENYAAFDVNNIKVINSLKYYYGLKSYCDSINSKLVIVFYPLSYIIHNEDLLRWKHQGVNNIKSQILFNMKFCDYLNQNGVVCLNLTDDLINEAITSHKRLYNWLDIHWTPYGNEITAKLVSKYLLKNEEKYFKN